jgi:hypothetical protein
MARDRDMDQLHDQKRLRDQDRDRLRDQDKLLEQDRDNLKSQEQLTTQERARAQEQERLQVQEQARLKEQAGTMSQKQYQERRGTLEQTQAQLQERQKLMAQERERLQQRQQELDGEMKQIRERELLTENGYRELQERWGSVFRAGMGAEAIRELCDRWGARATGCADDAIFARTGSGAGSIAEEFARERVRFYPARKADRITGWTTMKRLLADAGQPDTPGLYIARHCEYFWSTVPYLARDFKRVEDVDSRGPDHAADAVRYGCLHQRRTVTQHDMYERTY